ncbi:MAG: butyrate kinase [Thermotogaceae bacterium]|mgnify:CR=1 FL=1|nr:butyrate kinase [Thermotogota bacterium]NLZ13260.1 butyrate kinase [Thermotogaceae bacterium]
MPTILAINPGSTSTKVGIFQRTPIGTSEPIAKKTIAHDAESLQKYPQLLDQIQMRTKDIEEFVTESGFSIDHFDAFAARGGILPPMSGGTYEVNAEMVHYLKELSPVDHASNLAAVIAFGFAEKTGKKAYITDPVSTDEFETLARISGIPEIERKSFIHALNMKAVSRIVSKEIGKPYEHCNFVVAHLGGGISVGALKHGRFIDVNNANDEGPFSPERTGELPVGDVVKEAYSGNYSAKDLKKAFTKQGGLVAYLNTNDLRTAYEMAKRDSQAAEVIEAMVFQISKEIGGMCAVLHGKIDAIILTGGMAHLIPFVEKIKAYVYNFGLVTVVPGEDELKALAEGTFAVLQGSETASQFASSR